MLNKSFFLFIALIALLLCPSCKKKNENNVPDYPVQLDIQITAQYPGFLPEHGFSTLPPFTKVQKEGEYLGYAGVLVWVNAQNEYRAADIACPNCIRKDAPVVVNGIYATCPVCGEAFDLLYYGSPTKGQTNQPLKSYSTQLVYEGMNRVLRVRN